MLLKLFATAPKGLELLLADELRQLGAYEAKEKLAGVAFQGDLETAYKACLWSRLANRILLYFAQFHANTPQSLYQGAQAIAWDQHFACSNTFIVHCVCVQSQISHTLFAAQTVKDAIVDQMREKYNMRPSIDKEHPDISIFVYLYRDQATFYLDLSGTSLHKRGYRQSAVIAPIKENLAAGILIRAGWPELARDQLPLMDPMCGSGTFLIEAALIAGNIAPGLYREHYGFESWKQHNAKIWDKLQREAHASKAVGLKNLPDIVGYDEDKNAIKAAFENIDHAQLRGKIHVEKKPLQAFVPKASMQKGLVIVNPPYGERLSHVEALNSLYFDLGERLKNEFPEWKAAVFTGNPDLGKRMGLRAKKYYSLFNGAIPCKLLLFDIQPQYFVDTSDAAENARRIKEAQKKRAALSAGFEMFVNRLKKNYRHLSRRHKQDEKEYRIYDADLPEYAFAIDISPEKIHLQEYEAPPNHNKAKVQQHRWEVLAHLSEILNYPAEKIYYSKIRKN